MNELRQGRVGYRRDVPFAEVIIIKPKNSIIRPESQFVRAAGPGKIVIDKKPRCMPPLYPRVVEPSDVAERRIRTLALQYNWKGRQCLRIVARSEKTLVPRESRIEVVHQILRENVRVSPS